MSCSTRSDKEAVLLGDRAQ